MMKTVSGEMMRGADERDGDDADDDETKVAAFWGGGGVVRRTKGCRERRSLRRQLRFPRRSKSCHLATSCLFSTSRRPEGDQQAALALLETDVQNRRQREVGGEVKWLGKKKTVPVEVCDCCWFQVSHRS